MALEDRLNRFNFENDLVNFSEIVGHLEKFREVFELSDEEDNYILGLVTIYSKRFDRLFEDFEELIRRGQIT